MAEHNEILLDRLARSFAAVGELIDAIQPDQWSSPTPCMDWTVHRLVEHPVGKNLVFNAVLVGPPLPQRGDGVPSDQLAGAYRESAAVLLNSFGQPGVLDRSYQARHRPGDRQVGRVPRPRRDPAPGATFIPENIDAVVQTPRTQVDTGSEVVGTLS